MLSFTDPSYSNAASKISEPDFAFPETVAKNADESYQKALTTGDPTLMLRSLIDYVTAEELITRENTSLCLDRLVSAEAHASDPCCRALIDLMQAIIYTKYYTADRWNFDRRDLPSTPLPEDIAQWSGEQLRDKTFSLVDEALSFSNELKKAEISTFKGIINADRLQTIYYPTLYDFVACKSIDILSTFNSSLSAKAKASELVDSLINFHRDGSAPFINYTVEKLNGNATLSEFTNLYHKYSYSEFSGQFLTANASDYYSYKPTREYADMLREFVKKYPAYWDKGSITNRLNQILNKRINSDINIPLAIPGHPFTVDVTMDNANKAIINFYKLNGTYYDSYIKSSELPSGKPSMTVSVECDSIAPFSAKKSVQVTLPEEGFYAVVLSSPEIKNSVNNNPPVIQCTNLFGIHAEQVNSSNHAMISVNPTDGRPVAGVSVDFRTETWKNGRNTHELKHIGKTGSNGQYIYPATQTVQESGRFILSKGNSKFISYNSYISIGDNDNTDESYNATGYTSLALYRPGDNVDFVFVTSFRKGNEAGLLRDKEAKVILRDANYSPIDTLATRTDMYGRITGSMTIPKGLLTGQYTLSLLIDRANGRSQTICNKSFEVSDYKLPQFHVEITAVRHDFPKKGDVTLDGKALTYTDFPVAEAKVQIGLSTCTRMRWWYGGSERKITTADTVTATDGSFSITFDNQTLRSAESEAFTAQFDVTSTTGETQSCTKSFTDGKPYIISVSGDTFDQTKPAKLDMQVFDEEYKPVKSLAMTYKLFKGNDKDAVAAGDFNISDTSLDFSKLPQGKYRLSISTADTALAKPDEVDITLYNPEAKTPAVETPLWSPDSNLTFKNGSAKILYSTAKNDAYIYCITADSNGNFKISGFEVGRGYHRLTVKPLDNTAEKTYVTLVTVKDFKQTKISFEIANPDAAERLDLAVESFRDRLVPGNSESWTFKTTDSKGRPVKSAMILDVYNLALNKICQQYFSGNPVSRPFLAHNIALDNLSGYRINSVLNQQTKYVNTPDLSQPTFKDYGLGFGFSSIRNLRIRGMAKAKMQADADMFADDALVLYESVTMSSAAANGAIAKEEVAEAEVEEDGGETGGSQTEHNDQYRPAEMPLMMFHPTLETGADGTETIRFTVPNANASWRMALVAFTESLNTAFIQKDFITSKPLMVAANAPRFMRSGDKAIIPASVMNATDSTLNASVRIEIFDPITSDVISSETYDVSIEAGSYAKVETTVTANGHSSAIGYRVRATSGLFTDGEQIALPVLPSAESVIESKPFYLAPGTTDFDLTIPDLPSNAFVNLSYCDNPRWMVVGALPGLLKDMCDNANSASAAIYSVCMAEGIIKNHSNIREAIEQWSKNPSDSMLISMLEKNDNLKSTVLNATPWVREAADDTERMARLALLFDRKQTKANFDKAKETLKKLYASSGGWMWYAQAHEASRWTTQNILGMMGDLRKLGYLPKDKELDGMIESSVRWLDDDVVRSWKKYGHPENYAEYVFVRDLYPTIGMESGARDLTAAVVQYIVGNWRKYTLADKPMAAMILYKHGYRELAAQVLESMRQFSKYTPERGMWFPSFDDEKPWWNMPKNIATALALDAFAEIDPASPDKDRLAQWLILQKEAQNWGTSVATTQVISSLLHSAATTLQPASTTVFTLDGTKLNPSKTERLTGSFDMPLGHLSPSGKTLHLTRSGNNLTQAFGSIVVRYESNPADIKASDCDAVSITKRLLRREATDSGYQWTEADQISTGDRVKVLLTIETSRDMEYVVIDDNRAAAFEPVDQLPGYEYSEGVAFYRENSDAATRFFIQYMPKGTYMLQYELNVNNAGVFTSGLATIQSQYAPAMTAHSSGTLLTVGQK